MKRGLLVGFLLGFISVSVANARQDIYTPMAALRRVVALMEEMTTTLKQIEDDTDLISRRVIH